MLMKHSAIHGTSLRYPSTLEPGVQLALDLLATSPTLCPNDGRKMDELRVRASMLGISSASSDWRVSSSNLFSNSSPGQMSSPENRERFRPRPPVEVHMGSRPPPRSTPLEPLRTLPFTSPSTAYYAETPTFASFDAASNVAVEDTTLSQRRQSQDSYFYQSESPTSRSYTEYETEAQNRRSSEMGRSTTRYHTRRRPFNQDEFDGPSQLLPLPLPQQELARSQDLTLLPINLSMQEQDEVLRRVNEILSHCAYHFVAKYQFPIPLERDKPRVRTPADREWTEWAYLLKRLATKRRIPARVLFENQIKQFVTTLENSIAARQSRDQQMRTPRDDRYILQLISASTQVAKILMDSYAMEQLDTLYITTESLILERRARARVIGLQ